MCQKAGTYTSSLILTFIVKPTNADSCTLTNRSSQQQTEKGGFSSSHSTCPLKKTQTCSTYSTTTVLSAFEQYGSLYEANWVFRVLYKHLGGWSYSHSITVTAGIIPAHWAMFQDPFLKMSFKPFQVKKVLFSLKIHLRSNVELTMENYTFVILSRSSVSHTTKDTVMTTTILAW